MPTGFLLCNGQSISRVTYADLFEYLGTKYGSDSDETFKVPDYTNIFLQGADNNVGTTIAAGLPNITGRFCNWAINGRGVVQEGCCYGDGTTGAGGQASGGNNTILNIDASRSSSIYGNSTTVQPPAVTVNFCIKY